jgi:hypothetical protein
VEAAAGSVEDALRAAGLLAELIGFARRLDPGLTGREFADAGMRLDQMPDEAFTSVGLNRGDVAGLRQPFASWPRLAPQRMADLHAAVATWVRMWIQH